MYIFRVMYSRKQGHTQNKCFQKIKHFHFKWLMTSQCDLYRNYAKKTENKII